MSRVYERGITEAKLPLKTAIIGIPSYECHKCKKNGLNTTKIPDNLDKSFTQNIFSPIIDVLKKRAKNYEGPLPELHFIFNKNKESENRPTNEESQSIFRPRKPQRSLAHVVLPHKTLAMVNKVISFHNNEKLLIDQWGLNEIIGSSRYMINFFGPSGTGKTLTAEAIAYELGLNILVVNYAELESKWVGETPKNISAVFDIAENNNALLFFDEADSFLSRRISNISQSADYAVNVTRSVMLMRMESYKGVAVFATNLISNYDPAFARRFSLFVQFEIPQDPIVREHLWRLHIPIKLPLADDVDLKTLSIDFTNITGGDIKNAVISAAISAATRDEIDGNKKINQEDLRRSINEIIQAKAQIENNLKDKIDRSIEYTISSSNEEINKEE